MLKCSSTGALHRYASVGPGAKTVGVLSVVACDVLLMFSGAVPHATIKSTSELSQQNDVEEKAPFISTSESFFSAVSMQCSRQFKRRRETHESGRYDRARANRDVANLPVAPKCTQSAHQTPDMREEGARGTRLAVSVQDRFLEHVSRHSWNTRGVIATPKTARHVRWTVMLVDVPSDVVARCEQTLAPLAIVRVSGAEAVERLPIVQPLLTCAFADADLARIELLRERSIDVGAVFVVIPAGSSVADLEKLLKAGLAEAEAQSNVTPSV